MTTTTIRGPDGGHIELEYRSVLAPEQPLSGGRYSYAAWVRDLADKSGVYLIASNPERYTSELLYIGESHSPPRDTKRRRYRGLYRTLTRHFHIGGRWAQGITYSPYDVRVAVILTTPDIALDYQDALIAYYKPRDNELALELRGFAVSREDETESYEGEDGGHGGESYEEAPF